VNNSLERLIAGIIATLRTDVIPNVTDDYARGQAIGVIDLLNNIAPRLEWARAPLAEALGRAADAFARASGAVAERNGWTHGGHAQLRAWLARAAEASGGAAARPGA